jgi:hypothetical protein
MRARLGWLAWLVIVAACIALPLHALYGSSGPFSRQLANSAPWKSLDECVVLLGALYVAMRWKRGGIALGLMALALFTRRHGIDITLVLLAMYVGGLHALGRLCFPLSDAAAPAPVDTLRHVFSGLVVWSALVWISSAVGMGSIHAIRWLAIGVLGGALALDASRQRSRLRLPTRPSTPLGALLVALAITVVAMLAAKAAAALDSDAFWYGVNADRVLLGEGNLFHPQGLVVHVHYYPKLAEALQIPFLGLGSASLVAGFSLICWALLVMTARELLRETGVVSARLARGGALLAACVPAVLASAATPKGELLAAWLCLMALLAGMRLRHLTAGRESATWLAIGLVGAVLAPLARLTVLPYAAGLFAFVLWQGVRYRVRPTWPALGLAAAGAMTFVLVCYRTWAMTGVALSTPDVIVDLQAALGWHLHDDIGRYVPTFHTPFPSGLVQSLFGPSDYIHQALFWMGNAWLPLLIAAIALRGWRWMLRDTMAFWLALGLSMYALLYAYRYGPDGPDGNYFIVPIIVLHLVAWTGCTAALPSRAVGRPFFAGTGAMLAASLFLVLTTANWLPGLARLDANFRRIPFGELDRMALARFRISGMDPLARALAPWSPGTRMVGDMPEGDGGLFPVRYESLISIGWARPSLVATPGAARAFLASHGIELVALRQAGGPPASATVRAVMTGLETEGAARHLNVPGAPVDLWVLSPGQNAAPDGNIASRFPN